MLLKSLDQLGPHEVLAKTVQDEKGQPLLVAGTVLTEAFVGSLRRRGHLSVYVRDGLADTVVPTDVVTERVRATLAGHVAHTFGHVAAVAAAQRDASEVGVEGVIAGLGERPLDLGDEGRQAVQQLYADVQDLISEILESDTVAGLESLKTHNEYTFQHSVDVAVVGVILGKRLGLSLERLRELALGCLLHDIGKTYIDEAILDKPGPLTPEELAAIKEHPRMGFELVRRMPVHSLLPAHVAYQHHERQSGAGYPRGLVGHNSIAGRVAHERIGAGRMLLIAEIGAVADVYSALSSDRPYRTALPPDQVTSLMTRMAGGHLNRRVVEELRRFVPSYPVGRWVEVSAGPHAGWRGVVTDVHANDVDRPTVRLLLDAGGEEVAGPFEVDTRRRPDTHLVCVPGAQVAALVG
jgi:putative nucleotidyltransferase with HDIG domain